ncbi:hypothetical protein Tco_1064832 [Tanacetum coccineum]
MTVSDPTPLSSSPKPKAGRFRRYKTFIQQMGGRYGNIFAHLKKRFMPKKSFHELARILQSTMEEALPLMVGDRVNEITKKTVPLYAAEGLLLDKQKTQADVAAMIVEVDTFLRNDMSNNILHVHPTQAHASSAQDLQYQLYLMMKNDEKLQNDDLSIWWSLKIKFDKPAPSTAPCRTIAICSKDHDDHHDDAHPEGENSRKRQKIKERLSLPTPKKPALVFQSCQRDPKAPPMTLLNQDLFYLNHGNSGQKKYTLSLHKFPVVPFPNDVMEERTSRWKEQRENPERLYSDSKIIEVIRTSCELGHEQKFITEIIVRRANGKIDPITEPDYKYLNKNDIEDLYLLCVDGMESYQQKVNLTAPTITFHGIEKEKLFSITYELVIGMIYENNKKEKRVMIHKEIHKFFDATLKRVLEKLKKYKKDVKQMHIDRFSQADPNRGRRRSDLGRKMQTDRCTQEDISKRRLDVDDAVAKGTLNREKMAPCYHFKTCVIASEDKLKRLKV